jgi:hypothetical protein
MGEKAQGERLFESSESPRVKGGEGAQEGGQGGDIWIARNPWGGMEAHHGGFLLPAGKSGGGGNGVITLVFPAATIIQAYSMARLLFERSTDVKNVAQQPCPLEEVGELGRGEAEAPGLEPVGRRVQGGEEMDGRKEKVRVLGGRGRGIECPEKEACPGEDLMEGEVGEVGEEGG